LIRKQERGSWEADRKSNKFKTDLQVTSIEL
jgi:hypothetical protein